MQIILPQSSAKWRILMDAMFQALIRSDVDHVLS
jgi:hypothetical protein